MSSRRGPRCVFRVAAGPRLGYGHLMRARALARALGVRPHVSLRGGAAARDAARKAGCILIDPTVDPCDDVELLVVDDPSAHHAQAWVSRARRRGVRTVAVHDGGIGHSTADLVVDASAFGRRASAHRGLLSGPAFYLLDTRASHRLLVSSRVDTRRRVFIALGGGAHVRRVAGRLVSAIAKRCPSTEILVAAGFAAGRPPALPHGRWLVSHRGLTRQMAEADVVVTAGGVTVYEACALGCPTVGMAVVSAQRPTIRALASAGAVVDAGGPAVDTRTATRVGGAVQALLTDVHWRGRLSDRARRIVDGRGAERVAREIRLMLRSEVARG